MMEIKRITPDSVSLPDPDVIAAEIVEDLEAPSTSSPESRHAPPLGLEVWAHYTDSDLP